MVDIYTFCTDIEVVFSKAIQRYQEAVQELVRILKDTLTIEGIRRLMKVEFKFVPKWLHKRVRYMARHIWQDFWSLRCTHDTRGGD